MEKRRLVLYVKVWSLSPFDDLRWDGGLGGDRDGESLPINNSRPLVRVSERIE